MRCKRCGTAIDALEHFCRGCGKSIIALRQDNEVIYDDTELSQVELEKMNEKKEEKIIEEVKESEDIFNDALFDLQNNKINNNISKEASIINEYNKKIEITQNDNVFKEYEDIIEKEEKIEPIDINNVLDNKIFNTSNNEVINNLEDLKNVNYEVNRESRFINNGEENNLEEKEEPLNNNLDGDLNVFGENLFGLEKEESKPLEEIDIIDLDNIPLKEEVKEEVINKEETKEEVINKEEIKEVTTNLNQEINHQNQEIIQNQEPTQNVTIEPTKIKEKKKSKLPLILETIALILIVLSGVIFYFYMKTSPEKMFTNVLANLKTENNVDIKEFMSLDLSITMNEQNEISDVLNNLSLNMVSKIYNDTGYVKINPIYKGQSLLDIDTYLTTTEISVYLNDIYDKYIVVPVEMEINYNNTENTDILIEELIKEIKNNLTKEYLNRSISYEEINGKKELVTKSTFKINNDNYNNLLNSLKNNTKIVSIISEMFEVSTDEVSVILYYIFDSFNELSIDLYTRVLDNELLKNEINILTDETFKIELVKVQDGYDLKINEINGSIKIKDSKYEFILKSEKGTINLNIDTKLDESNLELPSINKKIHLEELTEKDMEKIEKNISKNKTLNEFITQIMSISGMESES